MADSTESTFRSHLSGFRWAQGRTDDSPAGRAAAATTTTNTGGAGSYLSTFSNSISGYVPLRSNSRTDEEEAYLSLSRWERLLGFFACLIGSAICFFFSFIFLNPFYLAIKPHKFAFAFSAGSILFMFGFSILSGPVAHFKHLTQPQRLPFTAAYFASLGLTLYFALGPKWVLPTMAAAAVQIVSLVFYLAAYFPGGTTTLRYGGSILIRGGTSLLPI
ncbi:SFT2-domain-containing protein [Tilletiaria anomala UBC 951]|uniref:Protein transport protein SFT2 n=1 Tax=Tilletiaria anomala (strain ATCC 24038 / CBS 436.72 / UBC 951) TaxID=1037660 RepID=A0A066VKF9_TILAU|nr:SFT2-domain-containing protein [Tilletiaria anomala UBC 951]KDN39244.1 SFT2-domain-containing protein [Tilletiaria anomala UBC 951]